MNQNHLNYEPSPDSKWLGWATTKVPQIHGDFENPSAVQDAHVARDCSWALAGFAFDAASLVILHSVLPFHPAIIFGLMAFDGSGSLMKMYGRSDRNWRAAMIAKSTSLEDKAALRSQRKIRYGIVNGLGATLIAVVCVFKIASLILLGALPLLGGWGPALLAVYVGVAIIHIACTPAAIAFGRKWNAERGELKSMLNSSIMESERRRHRNHVKAHREYHFASEVRLVPLKNVGGHDLDEKSQNTVGAWQYVLRTWGRFDSGEVDALVGKQETAEQMGVLSRHCLAHQIEIEASWPIASADNELPPPATTAPLLPEPTTPTVTPAMNTLSGSAALILSILVLPGLSACSKPKPTPVKLQVVSTKALAPAPEAVLPESIVNFAAPEKPIAGRYVMQPEATRLDLTQPVTEPLAPATDDSAVTKGVKELWRIESAELQAAQLHAAVAARKAGDLGKPGEISAEVALQRLAAWVRQARSDGVVVVGVTSRKDGGATVRLDADLEIPLCRGHAELLTHFGNSAANAPAGFAVVVEPAQHEPASAIGAADPSDASVRISASGPLPSAGTDRGQPVGQGFGGDINVIVNGAGGSSELPIARGANRSATLLALPENSIQVGPPIRFKYGSAKLDDEGRKAAEKVVAALKARAAGMRLRIIIRSSADHIDTTDKNQLESERRSETIKGFLLEHGFQTESALNNGENLAPDNTPPSETSRYREVRVFVSPAEAFVEGVTAQRLAW